jgi:kynurenine 3-monooxygenase
MATKHQNIVIVGAGLVGSLAALMLAKRGYTVNVFERRPDMRRVQAERGRSINLALSHRGRRALEYAGVATNVEEIGIRMPGRMIHNLDGSLTFQPYGKENEAIYSVSRSGLNIALLNAAEGFENVRFHFGYRCVDVQSDTAETVFERSDGSQSRVQADYILAADGAYSAVRFTLQKRDRFNYEQYYMRQGYKELTIPALANATDSTLGAQRWQMKPHALHIWSRGTYMLIALPNPDGSFTCTLFLPFESAHTAEPSFERLTSNEAVMEFFTTSFPDAVPMMPNLLDDFWHNPVSSLVTVKCSPWVHGRVALIGDAAHAIVPFYGQGMNAGFEDCRILAEVLEQHNDDWRAALRQYQELRKPSGDAIAQLAMENFVEMSEKTADPKFLLRKTMEQYLHEQFPERFVPVYSMVTFSHLPYSAALQESERQEQLFTKIFTRRGIEENWQTPEGKHYIHQCFEQLYGG